MLVHTEVVDGPLALRMRRLNAARDQAIGRQILTLPLLAARLAGGFIAPATQEILYPAIRQALEAGGYEDIDKVCQLPGMPAAVLSALRDWWDVEAPGSLPDNARLRDFTLLERRVRGAAAGRHAVPTRSGKSSPGETSLCPEVSRRDHHSRRSRRQTRMASALAGPLRGGAGPMDWITTQRARLVRRRD